MDREDMVEDMVEDKAADKVEEADNTEAGSMVVADMD